MQEVYYLHNAHPWQLTKENLGREFRDVLYDREASPEAVADELRRINRSDFVDILKQKGFYTQDKIRTIANSLDAIRLEVLSVAQTAMEQEKAIALLADIEQYLLSAPQESFTPEQINLNFTPILKDSDAEYELLRDRLSQCDRSTFERILAKRQDIAVTEAAAIIDNLERVKARVLQETLEEQGSAQLKVETQWQKLQSYLVEADKEKLNPQDIPQALKSFLDESQTSATLRARLARFDRHTLVQSLAQRNNLTEEEIDAIFDEVEKIWISYSRKPPKLVGKAQEQYDRATSAITDYLRRTGKTELNPEGIKRDLQLLFNDPRAGMGSLQERLSHFDRDTLVSLLSQREDISEADANRIIDQILVVREQMMEQLQSIQNKIQSALDRVFGKIRDYLNSLERPELNYDGLKHDLRTLFDDPKAGFEALHDRFSQFDRDTLVAILSSREDISKADVERIINQVERTRDRFLQRAERLQQEAKLRLEEVKREAIKQAEETRKTAAAASWWLFLTAVISALASAGAGAIGAID